ncbi:MAG: TonB-dependent receptor [Phenylobacterium sp.]|uniref:TonB-dependent receptor n=1 Tax=Phenylobacterium sp. TaxID=1871053 RepID=UPI0027357CDC|nr:TonB-dependent receptor [Phenylobacterium sp.]MDP3173692.1 TonB-dependent receptor [Phenylobacterium sp.]
MDQAPAVEHVVVTAARLPPLTSDAVFSIQRLDAGALRSAQRVDEAILRAPGISLFRRTSSFSANPTTQGVSLRAIAPSGAGRALVTLDRTPLNDPFGGWVIWSQLAPESIEGADIVRGAGAGPYGAGALTGTINLRERSSGVVAEVSAGGLGSGRAAVAVASSVGAIGVFATAQHETSQGYVPVRGARRGAADVATDLESWSLAGRIDYATPLGPLSLRGGVYDEQRGAGLGRARAHARGDIVSVTIAKAPTKENFGWRLQAWRRTSDLFNSSVSVAADRAITTPANSQDATPASGTGFGAAVRRQTGPLEWEVGADARINEGEEHERFRYLTGAYTRTRIAGGETSVVGLYLDGAWSHGDWLVAGGARVDRWRNSHGVRIERDVATGVVTLDERPTDRGADLFSARFGMKHEISQTLSIRAAAYSGFRPATLNELHRPFRVGNDVTEANASLQPERLFGMETGVAHRSDGGMIEVTAFWNRLGDPITNVTIGEGPATFVRAGFVPAGGVLRERRNVGFVDAVGLEGRAEQTLGPVDLSFAVAVTDARVDGGAAAAQLTGKRPAQAPIWSGMLGVSVTPVDGFDLHADLAYEGQRFEDDLNSRTLGAALRLGLRADWRISPHVSAYLTADNLLDAEVEAARTVDGVVGHAAPRILRIGLRVER